MARSQPIRCSCGLLLISWSWISVPPLQACPCSPVLIFIRFCFMLSYLVTTSAFLNLCLASSSSSFPHHKHTVELFLIDYSFLWVWDFWSLSLVCPGHMTDLKQPPSQASGSHNKTWTLGNEPKNWRKEIEGAELQSSWELTTPEHYTAGCTCLSTLILLTTLCCEVQNWIKCPS